MRPFFARADHEPTLPQQDPWRQESALPGRLPGACRPRGSAAPDVTGAGQGCRCHRLAGTGRAPGADVHRA